LVGPEVEEFVPADPASGQNATGQATTCAAYPCIDPDFAAVGGPTRSGFYWSASTLATDPLGAWGAGFNWGGVWPMYKTSVGFVRAVRPGSCSS